MLKNKTRIQTVIPGNGSNALRFFLPVIVLAGMLLLWLIKPCLLQISNLYNKRMDQALLPFTMYAALNSHQQMAGLLIEQGAEINSRDDKFGAIPAGWAIEHLREKGAYLAIELADLAYAIQLEDAKWVARFLERFPGLRTANDPDGISFQQLARASGNRAIIKFFE